MNKDLPKCNIVLPVYNGLTNGIDCINSIIEHSRDCPYHLFVIDDCSDSVTHNHLLKVAAEYPEITLQRNLEGLGFIKSCNIGISLSKSPYVVLLHSDVIVTPAWLSRLLGCAESDPRIALVTPLTNHASDINIPLAPGANFYGMDSVLAQYSPRHYPDVVTKTGFCSLLRRSMLDEVGLFDGGYREDSNLWMRLNAQGYRTVIADDVYVYHKGNASFSNRDERYRNNRKIFNVSLTMEYKQKFRLSCKTDPLKPARELFRLPQKWSPEPSMRETYRRMRNLWQHRDFIGIAREAVVGLRRFPKAKRDLVTPETVAQFNRPGRLRVTYVLHNLNVAGGVLSVVQLVNELTLLGVETRIVALREYPEIYSWKFLTRPIIFSNISELLENFPESDIAVATHWTTAPWVADVVKSGRAGLSAYFIQDYESWFFPEEDKESRKKVKETYRLIPHKIVKSDWLKSMLAKEGFSAKKILLGMDLGLFYQRDVEQTPHPVVLAMTRPRTPRRGFPYVIEALRRVKEVFPEVEIVLFGDDLLSQDITFAYRNEGIIADQNRLAELYSSADIFLDGSDFQGFGRCALEAMACGTACVLTNVGGVTEYGRNGDNCLLVPPKQPLTFAGTIMKVINTPELKAKLIERGLRTVHDYCHKREARETLAYFKEIFDRKDNGSIEYQTEVTKNG